MTENIGEAGVRALLAAKAQRAAEAKPVLPVIRMRAIAKGWDGWLIRKPGDVFDLAVDPHAEPPTWCVPESEWVAPAKVPITPGHPIVVDAPHGEIN